MTWPEAVLGVACVWAIPLVMFASRPRRCPQAPVDPAVTRDDDTTIRLCGQRADNGKVCLLPVDHEGVHRFRSPAVIDLDPSTVDGGSR